ncbi:acyl carrier protein [Rhizobium sp. RCC_161_2]|uniref:acyl carrier protein n=1 Tax=Rhizobium sp. RCC_161_2 TaxID=3239219 RepID=UPI003525722A
MNETIRELLTQIADIARPVGEITDDADLYSAGLSSFASIQLMLGLEDRFDIEFPEHSLNRKSFASIKAIEQTISQILKDKEAA